MVTTGTKQTIVVRTMAEATEWIANYRLQYRWVTSRVSYSADGRVPEYTATVSYI